MRFGLRQAEFAAAQGMHPTDVRALIRLLDAERSGTPATASHLGEGLGLNSAGTTSVIDRLERLGHVERVRDSADRRRVLLRVNERARELGWAHFGPMIDVTTRALDGLGAEQRAAVRDFLTAARDAVG
ncbi:MarR family transcriptional regulator [Streptomyces sp. DW26H14]|uniref:MarR family transcriptional regulator n=1 Tax=Streptomyces sp. DW26H14 TaxID=3435395 RepID=UPI00403D653F